MDRMVPFQNAQRLFDRATQPKYYLWVEQADHEDILNSEGAARVIKRFFQVARNEPVI